MFISSIQMTISAERGERSTPQNSLAALNGTLPSSLCFFEVTNDIQAQGLPEAMTSSLAAGQQ